MADNFNDKWRMLHFYSDLVDKGFAEPIRCASDGSRLYRRLDEEDPDNPRLFCYTCQSMIVPGSQVYDQIREVTERYYDIR